MEWQHVLTLIFVVPFILFPAAFIWYIIIKGTSQLLYQTYRKKQGFAATAPKFPAYYKAGSTPCAAAAMGHIRRRTPYQPGSCNIKFRKGKLV